MMCISRVLGKLIENYVKAAVDGGRDCRLLVPGLTREIGRQVHEYLLEDLHIHGVSSYLIVGDDEQPNDVSKQLNAVGLTSKRIGSFIAIVNPGQLVHIQDSIRGSGGTIRSPAFSEEWPWIDDGSEQFRFDGPVLDALVKEWSSDPSKQEWLHDFVLEGLLKPTRSYSLRAHLLLEEILGTFTPDLYPEIVDVREKFLYHAGIPRPTATLPTAKEVIQHSVKLCKNIVDRCQKEENIREQVRDMALEITEISPEERELVRQSADVFLDGVGRSSTLDLGLLAFHGCWGYERDDISHWWRLHADRLADLFDVRLREEAEVWYNVHCERGLIDSAKKNIATFYGEEITLDVNYRISADLFNDAPWAIRVLNRQRKVTEQPLDDIEGEVHFQLNTNSITNKYSSKIPLRIALVCDEDVKADARLNLHLCGEERPAFVVVEHRFDIVDASEVSEEGSSDKKITANIPIHLFLFSHETGEVSFCDEDDRPIDLIETGVNGIWRSAHRVDVTAEPSGQVTRICKFGDLAAVICIEAADLEKGEFTIEEELRVQISRGKENSLKHLVNLFEGQTKEPYPSLGKVDTFARKRIHLAKIVTTQEGWRPLLVNLLELDFNTSGPIGNFIAYLGPVEEAQALATLNLPDEAVSLLKTYSEARNAILQEIRLRLDTGNTNIEHPIYASHPIYAQDRLEQTENLICKYLEAYHDILAYVKSARSTLGWDQLFVLTHTDCVVHWDNTQLRNAFFLIGPWHPLVLAKRFMVQAALYSRANRYLNDTTNGKKFRQLCALLDQVQGFRWIIALSAADRTVEPAFVSTTSDPGWHVAFKSNFPILSAQRVTSGLPELATTLWQNLGLAVETGVGGNANLPTTALSNYLRAFPSRRSIGIRVRHGYTESEVAKDIDAYLHAEVGPTELGEQLPGGIRLYLEKPLDRDLDARWSDPPLSIYLFENDDECILKGQPDIYMLPPTSDLSFRPATNTYKLPRGFGRHAVFYEPLRRIDEGNTLVPKSFAYESDPVIETGRGTGIGGMFTAVLGQITDILGAPTTTVSSIELPQVLKAPWVIIPGQSLDPAILVKYVHDGIHRSLQERALWDYKLDMTGRADSFFILSTIPREFQVAVNGFFGRNDIAGGFIAELGKIGIAIGGEALKTGRHALGTIGLVGAVRLFTEQACNGRVPISCCPGSIGFLVPVDSFASFFGRSDPSVGKRTDLLAIHLALPDHGSGKMRISACGVESKFVSGTFSQTRAHAALKQGLATTQEFNDLVVTSLQDGAMPERLGLLELLQFGLRITSPSAPGEIDQWLDTERQVYQAILAGEYEYLDAAHRAVLVSTEGSLPGVAESTVLQEGLWVRLTKEHWPGISNTPSIDNIRRELCNLFEDTRTSPPCPPSSPADIPSTPQEGEEEPEPVSEPDVTHVAESQVEEEPVELDRDAPLKQIFIGADEVRRMIYFNPQSPVDPLDNMNIMVTGSSGKGKTQFLKYLICMFRDQGKNVLILDFKNDFASDSTFCEKARLEKIFVTFDGLPYNPLIPYPVQHPGTGELFIQPGHHIAGITSVLKRTYGLGVQQQAAVKRAINRAFALRGIQTTGSTPFKSGISFPDFSDVGDSLQHENPTAYSRLDPLFTLDLFRNEFRDRSFHALVNRATVIDLSQIPSDEIKNALAQLIVLSAHAYYNAQPHSGTLRQFLVFDEAHRVLSSDYILRLVRECRAYGVGVVLSSQYPSDFPGEISASMATKIIHGNDRDAERTRAIVQLLGCEGREGDVASLDRFQAFLDNRHSPQTLLRTMNYPLYLVWVKLQELGTATREELSQAEGVNVSQLPIVNLVRQLELLGLAEERDGQVVAIRREDQ